jgi:thiol-disulfide isomerase/thioredoxin
MKKNAILIILICLLSAFNHSTPKKGYLAASLKNISDGAVLYVFDVDSDKVFRKVIVKDGKFEFEFDLQVPRLCVISNGQPKYPKDQLGLWLENSNIQITGDYNYLFKAKVEGSNSNKINEQFKALQKGFDKRLNVLKIKADTSGNDLVKRSVINEKALARKQYKEEKMKLYSEYLESEVAFSYLFSETIAHDSEFTKDEIARLYNKLPSKFKFSKKGELVKDFVSYSEPTHEEGTKFIDFAQFTPEGKTESISGNLGKYTIIDFWASWCKPCRAKHPLMRKLYALYHIKGLNIINISGDTSRKDWQEAIRNDSIPWTNISDLKGFHNKAFLIYNIRSIPKLILLDKNGLIIDNDFGNKDLEREMKKLFCQ